MTEDRLAAIKAKNKQRTSGEWIRYADDDSEIGFVVCNMHPEGWPVMMVETVPHAHRGTDETHDNMEFIAACSTEVPWLIEEVERLTTHKPSHFDKIEDGPDYCAVCSEIIGDWVKWPCLKGSYERG